MRRRWAGASACWNFDMDGRPDLIMANGHIYPELKAAYRQSKSLYWNGGGAFATIRTGAAMASRGLAVGDLDGDGTAEVIVANMNTTPSVYKVDRTRGVSLGIRLEGTRGNRSAIGARVTVTVAGKTQTEEVRSGGSYGSQHDFTLLFGLGAAKVAERVEVRWPNGETEVMGKLEVGALYRMKEGAGVVGRVPWR